MANLLPLLHHQPLNLWLLPVVVVAVVLLMAAAVAVQGVIEQTHLLLYLAVRHTRLLLVVLGQAVLPLQPTDLKEAILYLVRLRQLEEVTALLPQVLEAQVMAVLVVVKDTFQPALRG